MLLRHFLLKHETSGLVLCIYDSAMNRLGFEKKLPIYEFWLVESHIELTLTRRLD